MYFNSNWWYSLNTYSTEGEILENCEMFGCHQIVYNKLSIGPGTNVAVCEHHYIEFMKALAPEYPNQYEDENVHTN